MRFIYWEDHVKQLSTKLSKNIGVLLRLKLHLTTKLLHLVYNSLILPYLTYCNLIWSCASPSTINRIVTLQKNVRIINKAGYRDHTTPLFKKLGLLKVEDIHRQQILICMYKFSSKQLPGNFSSYFHETSTVHFHFTRNSDGYFIPSANKNIRQKCIRHSGLDCGTNYLVI